MLPGFIKVLLIHFLSLTLGILLWIYLYINGIEQYVITMQLKIQIPQNYVIVEKNKNIPIKIIVQTNRKYKRYLPNNYYIHKKVAIKGRIFPKRVNIKIEESDIQLPDIFTIVSVIDKNISVSCDILKDVIFPLQPQSITYKGDELKHYTISIEPDYLSLKVPSGLARITKAIYLNPINLNELPTKTTVFEVPLPEQFYPYLQEKIRYIKISVRPYQPFIENTITQPIKLVILPKVIQSKIKNVIVKPASVQLTIQYPRNVSLSNARKNISCYVEIKKIIYSIQTLPIFCIVKKHNLQAKVKIVDISKMSAKVKISTKRK